MNHFIKEEFVKALKEVFYFVEKERIEDEERTSGIEARTLTDGDIWNIFGEEFELFYKNNKKTIEDFIEKENLDFKRFVHLYYYNRNGHGVGFWDYESSEARTLDKLTENKWIEFSLSDDGEISFMVIDVNKERCNES